MPKGSAVEDVERKLKSTASKKGLTGKRAASYVHGTLNNIGLKKGSKTTAKGMKPAKSKGKAKDLGAAQKRGNFPAFKKKASRRKGKM